MLYVVQGEKHPALYSKGLLATDLTWISGEPPQSPFRCTAKFRYRQPDQGVIVHFEADGSCRVEFDQPQKAITPGQSVVFYDGDVCLGGAVIDKMVK